MSTIVSAAENTSGAENTLNANSHMDERIVKTSAATALSTNDQEAECYYGGRLTYNLQSADNEYVDNGQVELYVNNTRITSKDMDGEDCFDWQYPENNELSVLNNYPSGQYPIKFRYTYEDNSIESNTATLTIHPGQADIYILDTRTEEGNIIVSVDVSSSATYEKPKTGNITAITDTTVITSIPVTEDNMELIIPAKYQQQNIQVLFSDNQLFFEDSTEDLFLDVIVPGTGGISTQIEVNDMQLCNITDKIDDETLTTALGILVSVNVRAENKTINSGVLRAYYNQEEIATSKNASSIIIPAKYNLEEITLNYTGINDYSNSTLDLYLMVDKISTKSYVSYISSTRNSIVNIYPSISSTYPFLYGKLNIYLDGNLVNTINAEDATISLSGGKTTIYTTLDLSGLTEGEYNVTVEVEENNLFTQSEYTTRLTIQKVNTYISAYDRTIYIGDSVNLYARVYANNMEEINTGQMSFTLDGELLSTEYVNNNTANMEYIIPSTLNLGKHTLLVTYEDNEYYNTSSKEITLTLARTSTTTTLRTWTVEDEKIVLNTTVRAWNKTINTGNITVYIDNTKITTSNITDNSSAIILPANILTDKKYNLRIVYSGDELLNTSTYENNEFIFNRKNTTTRVYPYLRSNGTLTLTSYVYSENYAKVNNGNIIYTINGEPIATAQVTNNRASASYDMGDYDPGNYTIMATYNGSTLFRTSTNTSMVSKNPYYHKTYMNIANRTLTVKIGGSTDINATITSYSRNVTEDINAKIVLNATWASEVYSQDVVFHNGILNTKLNIPADFELFEFYGQEINKYTLTIISQQSKNFQKTSQTATVTIGEPTRIYQKALWGYKGANITFNSTLQDTTGKKLNTNTTAKIDIYTTSGELITSFNKQIVNGQLSYAYKLPGNMTEGIYVVNITAKSNLDYSTSYRTVNMTLNNRKTYISAVNTKGYIGNTVIFNGTITDSITRTQSNTNNEVDILIDGQKIAIVTANNGTFKYTLKNNNYTAGIHTLTYNYKGDTLYANSTRTLNFTSNKNTLRIATSTITAKIGDNINIKANITNTSGSPVVEKLHAKILLNNKTIADNLEVTNGQLSYTYTIPAGTDSNSKITIIIEENSKYNTRNASTTLKINKDYQFITLTKTIITTSKGSTITITGNITDKYRNLVKGSKVNIKIDGTDIANITSTDGKINYEYTATQEQGTYDITLKALESNSYLYNAKHMTLKVT